MTRIRRSLTAALVVGTLSTGALVVATPQSASAAGDPCGSTTGMDLGSGTETYLGVQVNQSTIKSDALAGVRKWRQDALDDTSVTWGGKTMKAYLASQHISEQTYLNPQWSYDLERIATQRAAELTVTWGHTRPNGEDPDVTSNGVSAEGEIIAANSGTMTMSGAIGQWANEKSDYVGQTGGITGHYTSLIDPDRVSYGFGLTDHFAAGETSSSASGNTAATGWSGTCQFDIPLKASDIASVTMTPTSAIAGQTKAITTTVTSKPLGSWPTDEGFTFTAKGTLSSANKAVATASGSSLTGIAPGTSAISMASGDQTLSLGTFTVTGNAVSSIDPVTVTTESGTAPVLPATVTEHWSNGSTTTAAVTWGTVPTTWKNRAGGTFTVNGTVQGTSKPAVATVTVKPAQVTSYDASDGITTPAGVAPTLPKTASVHWSNGNDTTETITWNAIAASNYAHPGSFTATGTVAGASIERTVTVTASIVSSIEKPSAATTVGVTPTLPKNVAVTWSDGSTTQAPVSWSLDSSQYANAGTSTVNGTVTLPDGSTRPTTLTLTVGAPGFSPLSGSTPAATGRIGEATGDTAADVWALDNSGTLDFYRYGNGGLTKLGVRGQGLTQISYLAPITDQNGDGRADMMYRDSSDQSLWFAFSQGNGYLTKGIKVGTNWGGMDQIFYAGTMVAGSPQQYVLARRASDGTLWRYNLSSSGLSHGVQVGQGWGGMRVMLAPGNMSGDAAWDIVGIRTDGLMFAFESRGGLLAGKGEIGHGWAAMVNAFSPGDITGDGRLDLVGQRSDGTLWAYANTPTGFSTIGQVGSGFSSYRLMA